MLIIGVAPSITLSQELRRALILQPCPIKAPLFGCFFLATRQTRQAVA
jgi:hypothetical protein